MIYLIRHGTIQGHQQKRFIGQVDVCLDENGSRQARFWREKLAGIGIKRIYCSSLARSVETARIIAGDKEVPLEVMPELREINLGAWDGLSVAEVRRRFSDGYELMGRNLSGYRPPGGESFSDLHRRVVPVFERITGDMEGPVLIVAHAGVNRMILCHVLGMPLGNLFRLEQEYGALSVIACKDGVFRLRSINVLPVPLNEWPDGGNDVLQTIT